MPPALRLTWLLMTESESSTSRAMRSASYDHGNTMVVVVVEVKRRLDDERAAAPARCRQLPCPAFITGPHRKVPKR